MADDYDDIDEQNPRDRSSRGYFDFSYLYKPPEQKDTLPSFLDFDILPLIELNNLKRMLLNHLI